MNITTICELLLSFLIGAIPFGYVVGRINGVNVLKKGSGSIGATNVRRTVGKSAAYAVFLLDCLKGCIAAKMPSLIGSAASLDVSLLALLLAMVGHSFSPFLKFRGGKGVAVVIGGLALMMPNVLCIGLIFWTILFSVTRFVSLSSIGLAAILPLASYLFYYPSRANVLVVLLSLFIILRHISNVKRLIQGKELRFDRMR